MKPQFDQVGLSIVIPCLNESRSLGEAIRSAQGLIHLLQVPGEIIVADNGSNDGSQEVALSLGARIVSVDRMGYGAALIYGCRAASGSWIVIGDADGSYNFRDAAPMVHRLAAGADLVVGTRLKGKILPGAMPWKNRYIGNPLLTSLLNLFFHSGLSDAQCGLRAFTREAFDRMELRCVGMEFASEMIVKATLAGMRCEEQPITYYPDHREGNSHLRPWRDGWRHIRFLLFYSPGYLYVLFGLALFLIGAGLNTVLALLPDTVYIWLGSLFFGTHWSVPATLAAVLGLQLAYLGIFSTAYAVQSGFYPKPKWYRWVVDKFNLEVNLLVGLATIGLGAVIEGSILFGWIRAGFGTLAAVRQSLYGLMWIVLGAEWMANNFVLGLFTNAVETIPEEAENPIRSQAQADQHTYVRSRMI